MYQTIELPGFSISTYFLVISLSICLGLWFLKVRASRRGLNARALLDIGIGAIVTGFFGSRLFHILFEEPRYYIEAPQKVLAFQDGGYVYYGGFLAAVLFCLILIRLKKLNLVDVLDCSWAPVALGYGLGRVSCFLAGCCYGRFCDLPWAIQQKHPTQLYAVFWELAVLALLLWIERIRLLPQKGQIFFVWLGLHGLGRILMEFYRDDFRGPEWGGLSLSTWISLGLIIFSAQALVRSSRQPPKPR